MKHKYLIVSIICFTIAAFALYAIGEEITDVTVKGVIRNLRADTAKRVVSFSVSIVDEEGNQIGARGFEVPFGETKAETLANCREAIKGALRPVAREALKWANRPAPEEAHLDFDNRALDFDYPNEKLTLGAEVPLPKGEGDYGP